MKIQEQIGQLAGPTHSHGDRRRGHQYLRLFVKFRGPFVNIQIMTNYRDPN